jgi:O-antigen ligase/tetratricopeptide (TPR) repeat protein
MQLNKTLRAVAIGAIFLVPLVPLVVSSSLFFPFITGKNVLFRVLTEIAFGAWAILALRDRRYRPKLSWALLVYIAFMLILTIADFAGENPYKSFWSNFERMEGLVTHLHLFAFFLITSSLFTVEDLWKRFMQTNLCVSIIVGFYGLSQLFGISRILQSATRLDATLGNSDYLAVYMLFNIFFALFLAFRSNKKGAWWSYGLIALFDIFILYYTATRGVILGLLVGLFITGVIIALFERQKPKLRKVAIGCIAAIVIIVGGFISVRNTQFVQNNKVLGRFSSISIKELTTGARTLVWNMAYQGFKERPVLGWGQENFSYVFNKYYDPRMYGQEQWFDRTHNVFLDWLIAGGVFGLLAYLSLFATGIYYIVRKTPHTSRFARFFLGKKVPDSNPFSVVDKSILIGLLGGYFFQNLFVFDNVVSYILFFGVLAYLSGSWRHLDADASSKKELGGTTISVGSAVIVVVTVFALYTMSYKPYAASATLIKAITPSSQGVNANLGYFKQALAYKSVGIPEIREQLLQVGGQIIAAPGVPDAVKQDFAQLIDTQYKEQFATAPNDTRYYLFYGTYLSGLGQNKAAIASLEHALLLSPRKQQILFALGAAYISDSQYSKAFDDLKYAYDLEKDNPQAVEYYAAAAIYVNKPEIVKELYGTDTPPVGNIARAYSDSGRLDKAKVVALKVVAASPNDPDAHLVLASIYLKLNDKAGAIAEIKKVIELNPNFADRGNAILQELQK